MTAWTAFASVAGVVTVLLLLLSQTTSERFGTPPDDGADDSSEGAVEREVLGPERPPELRANAGASASDGVEDVALPGGRERVAARELREAPVVSQSLLLLNVALSQGVFGVVLVVAAVAADVPAAALGVAASQVTPVLAGVGVVLGVTLYAVDEVGASVADAAGFGRSEGLREFLAPDSVRGWALLLAVVLPVVAGFEELLFRAVLVGAFSTGFGVSPWLLAVASSILFGLGHGAQGRLGIVVTTALGLVLAAAYVVSGSLLVVVVAHYLVNALEFVVHEGLELDPVG